MKHRLPLRPPVRTDRPRLLAFLAGLAVVLMCLTWGCSAVRGLSPSRVYKQHPSIVTGPQAPASDVYFVRERQWMGLWVSYEISLNGEILVLLRSGRYARLSIEPGTHILGTADHLPLVGSAGGLTDDDWGGRVAFEAGKTYFVKFRVVALWDDLYELSCDIAEFVGPGNPESQLGEYKLINQAPSMAVE